MRRMIDLNMTVEEALTAHPALAGLFVRRRMLCVGCDIARFHTLREAVLTYEFDLDEFREEAQQVCTQSGAAVDAKDSLPHE